MPNTAGSVALSSQSEHVVETSYRHLYVGMADIVNLCTNDAIELEAEGCYITTADGTRYWDIFCAKGVFNLGHRHPRVVKAVTGQLNRMPLCAWGFFHNIPLAQLGETLARLAPGSLNRTSFFSSSSESMDIALKTARLATKRTRYIGCWEAYHGLTMGAQSVSGQRFIRPALEPLLDSDLVEFGDIESLRKVATREHAALVLETVQGQSLKTPPADYFRQARALCDELGILMIVDETQTGLGRTGKLFGIQHHGVTPDFMILGKALSGGVVPISACVYTDEVADKVGMAMPWYHGSTFGGNELSCTAGLAALAVTVEEKIPERVAELGEHLHRGLGELAAAHGKLIREVRGLGFFAAMEFHETLHAYWFQQHMFYTHKTLVVIQGRGDDPTAFTIIKLYPPLISERSDIDRLLQILRASLEELAKVGPEEFKALGQRMMSSRLFAKG